MRSVDLFVIGTGTAGLTAAAIANQAGLSVGIADEVPYGGTCALRGCQPKKFLVVPAHAAWEAIGLANRGFVERPRLDWTTMQRSREEFTSPIPTATEEGLRKEGIETFNGTCSFVDTSVVRCGDVEITAKRVLIATGARPRPLVVDGAQYAVTSDHFLYMPQLPPRIAFIGGGYISMEFGTVAGALGAKVTVLQRGSRVMERFDPDLVETLQAGCAARAIDVLTAVELDSIRQQSDESFVVSLRDGRSVAADLVVAALGRIPNIETLNLDRAGIQSSARGIAVDATMRTTNTSVYAVGDCVTGMQLAPVSDAEARVAARNVVDELRGGDGSERIDLSMLPTVVFTYPQLAQFGLSEVEARERGGVRVNYGSGAGWPNYRRLDEKYMAYKTIIDEKTDQILGAHILAPHAGELINTLALAAKAGFTASAFREVPWAYPTYTADLKYMLS